MFSIAVVIRTTTSVIRSKFVQLKDRSPKLTMINSSSIAWSDYKDWKGSDTSLIIANETVKSLLLVQINRFENSPQLSSLLEVTTGCDLRQLTSSQSHRWGLLSGASY